VEFGGDGGGEGGGYGAVYGGGVRALVRRWEYIRIGLPTRGCEKGCYPCEADAGGEGPCDCGWGFGFFRFGLGFVVMGVVAVV
jgi:hypothetical protein